MRNFAVLEHDIAEKKRTLLQNITAEGPEEARAEFLKIFNWRPKNSETVLVVKFLGKRSRATN